MIATHTFLQAVFEPSKSTGPTSGHLLINITNTPRPFQLYYTFRRGAVSMSGFAMSDFSIETTDSTFDVWMKGQMARIDTTSFDIEG